MNDKPIVIDLFCGCGGFSKGFQSAGFNIALGLDTWKDATVTYGTNFPNAVALNRDITETTAVTLLNELNGLTANDIDVIIGGPPCQGFSLSGKRMLDDPRNQLYKSFVDLVKEIKPKVFVMENVLGLIRLFNGRVKDEVIKDFSELGYNVQMQVMSSDNYGVPQQRKRVFFVGVHKKKLLKTKEFQFPLATHGNIGELSPYVTCKDAISDLDFVSDAIAISDSIKYPTPPQSEYQKLMRKNSENILNHVITIHKDKTKEIISLVPDGGNYKSLPKELWATRKVNIAWTRMNSNKACFTIDTGHNHHFHYRANRVPSVRESARIQSFPDSFRFVGIKTSQLKQVGNAVPPLVAEHLALQIKKILEKED